MPKLVTIKTKVLVIYAMIGVYTVSDAKIYIKAIVQLMIVQINVNQAISETVQKSVMVHIRLTENSPL